MAKWRLLGGLFVVVACVAMAAGYFLAQHIHREQTMQRAQNTPAKNSFDEVSIRTVCEFHASLWNKCKLLGLNVHNDGPLSIAETADVGLASGPLPPPEWSATWRVHDGEVVVFILRVSPKKEPDTIVHTVVNGEELFIGVNHVHEARSIDESLPRLSGMSVRKFLAGLGEE